VFVFHKFNPPISALVLFDRTLTAADIKKDYMQAAYRLHEHLSSESSQENIFGLKIAIGLHNYYKTHPGWMTSRHYSSKAFKYIEGLKAVLTHSAAHSAVSSKIYCIMSF